MLERLHWLTLGVIMRQNSEANCLVEPRSAFIDLVQRFIDALNDNVAVIDESSTILLVNAAWRRFALGHGMKLPNAGVGANYRDICARAGEDGEDACKALSGLLSGQALSAEVPYSMAVDDHVHDYLLTMSRMKDGERDIFLLIHQDLERCARREEPLQLELQERRKIARELHDGTAQHLAAVEMFLCSLKQRNQDPVFGRILEDAQASTRTALAEMRSYCFLLHPPVSPETKIEDALRDWLGGYSKRIGLPIGYLATVEHGSKIEKLRTALFRVVQESLMNVHRHANATYAHVELRSCPQLTTLSVKDDGRGLGGAGMGVGIASMRERVRELGGSLDLQSSTSGTEVWAMFPSVHDPRCGSPARPI